MSEFGIWYRLYKRKKLINKRNFKRKLLTHTYDKIYIIYKG
jgi:hypothetical protein